MDSSDNRHLARHQSFVESISALEEGAVLAEGLAPGVAGEVAAAAERPTISAQDNAADGRVLFGKADHVEDLVAGAAVSTGDRIEHVGAIEGDGRDVAVDRVGDLVELHRRLLTEP